MLTTMKINIVLIVVIVAVVLLLILCFTNERCKKWFPFIKSRNERQPLVGSGRKRYESILPHFQRGGLSSNEPTSSVSPEYTENNRTQIYVPDFNEQTSLVAREQTLNIKTYTTTRPQWVQGRNEPHSSVAPEYTKNIRTQISVPECHQWGHGRNEQASSVAPEQTINIRTFTTPRTQWFQGRTEPASSVARERTLNIRTHIAPEVHLVQRRNEPASSVTPEHSLNSRSYRAPRTQWVQGRKETASQGRNETASQDRNETASSVEPEHTVNIRTQNTAARLHSDHGRNKTTSSVEVNVIHVPDGDGVMAFDLDAEEILNVRLIGIDAPEMKGCQPFALQAKRHLEGLVLRETAILTKYDLDQYERVLGNLKVPGKVENVSLEMLKAGLACVYKGKGAEYGGMRRKFYQAERLAKRQKKGFWASDNVILPGEFKRMQRELSPR